MGGRIWSLFEEWWGFGLVLVELGEVCWEWVRVDELMGRHRCGESYSSR